ncbi:hypothetical protein F5050DRAFT_1813618 [Lentinula boryana]|uniref:Uncharacterized protein n=1 Tax=Lentinula boryana TaxID=40481 RepID=A0ABQ8PW84_9AGAR|nr:hypothetical protein F5050DRAFT_1813618 [Lentinula boryana]
MHLHDVFDRQLFARAAHVNEEDAKTVQDMLQIAWEQIAGEALELARPLSPEIRDCAREYVFVNNPEDYRGCRASAHEEWTRTITSSAEIIPYDKLTTDERHKHEDIDFWLAAAEVDKKEADRVFETAEKGYLEAVGDVIGEEFSIFNANARNLLHEYHPNIYNDIRLSAHEEWNRIAMSATTPPGSPTAPHASKVTGDAHRLFDDDQRVERRYQQATQEEEDAENEGELDGEYGENEGNVDGEYEGEDEAEEVDRDEVGGMQALCREDDDDDEIEDEDDDQGMPSRGRLPKELMLELDRAAEEDSLRIQALAKKYNRTVQACRQYQNVDHVAVPRKINAFNAFKHYRREFGPHEGIPVAIAEYNKYMKEEYWKVLRERIPKEQLNNPTARHHAMKEELDFLQSEVDCQVQGAKDAGKTQAVRDKMLKPIFTVVCVKTPSTMGSFLTIFLGSTDTRNVGFPLGGVAH